MNVLQKPIKKSRSATVSFIIIFDGSCYIIYQDIPTNVYFVCFLTFLAVFVKFLAIFGQSQSYLAVYLRFLPFYGLFEIFQSSLHAVSTSGFILVHNLGVSMTLLAFFC